MQSVDMEALTPEQQIIVKVLKDSKCKDMQSALSPSSLKDKCALLGLSSGAAVEKHLVGLIDMDIVEYEMDDDDATRVTHLWLL
jgi:hypothetical protein